MQKQQDYRALGDMEAGPAGRSQDMIFFRRPGQLGARHDYFFAGLAGLEARHAFFFAAKGQILKGTLRNP